MAKRPAEETLEVSANTVSPATKKTRVEKHVEAPIQDRKLPNGHREERQEASRNIQISDISGQKQNGMKTDSEEEDDEQQSAFTFTTRQNAPTEGYSDLYLDTIDRAVLDFDFEKLCSVSLSNINVYACLVCGKYFQGRGPKSHAYYHALEVGHHVYVNMASKKVYVLPEGYEVESKSLDDIKFQVDPHLSKQEVQQLDREPKEAWDLLGRKYRPGKLCKNIRRDNIADENARICWDEQYQAERLLQRCGSSTRPYTALTQLFHLGRFD